MTIRLITGVPGSGKTCLALKLLTDLYFNYSSQHDQFFLKPEFQDITIISNIDGLKLEHISLEHILTATKLDFYSFFNYEYQEKISKKYPKIIYVLDECQIYLSPKRLKNLDTIIYFDKHRHLDHEIFLITQDFKKIHIEINTLAETEFRLTKRSFSVFGEFRYLCKSSGEVFDQKSFKPPKHIFRIYKSFTSNQNQIKHKNIARKYILVPVFLFLISGFIFYSMLMPDTVTASKQLSPLSLPVVKPTQILKTDLLTTDKLIKIPIVNVIRKDNKLTLFQCPITGVWYRYGEQPYTVSISTKNGNFVYLVYLSQDEIKQIRSDFSFLFSPSVSDVSQNSDSLSVDDRFSFPPRLILKDSQSTR